MALTGPYSPSSAPSLEDTSGYIWDQETEVTARCYADMAAVDQTVHNLRFMEDRVPVQLDHPYVSPSVTRLASQALPIANKAR